MAKKSTSADSYGDRSIGRRAAADYERNNPGRGLAPEGDEPKPKRGKNNRWYEGAEFQTRTVKKRQDVRGA